MRDRLRIFIGTDKRQLIAYNVLRSSLEHHASAPLDIQPLNIDFIPMKRRGLTDFSFTRYMVPYLCGYQGHALFMDADMLCLDDIYKLEAICSPQNCNVAVVKNPRRFEWSSLMYFDCFSCHDLTPELIEKGTPMDFRWANFGVGDIPTEYNHLVSYDAPNPNAKIVHFSCGIPVWKETANSEHADKWIAEYKRMNSSVSFEELMGRSVHVPHLDKLKVTA